MNQAADLFCGAGGTSTGLLEAAKELNQDIKLVAINHWEMAIATHSENHPDVYHLNVDLQDVDPRQVVPSGKLRFLIASPECTHFSKARGGKPMSRQSRASVKYVLRWVNSLDVEDVLIENVPDFQDWGPLHRTCTCGAGVKADKHLKKCHYEKPIKKRRGEYFHRFIRKMEQSGYRVAWRILHAADYGDPTTRKRLFIIARKYQPIRWPEPTHHKNGGDMFGASPRWKAAREIIDWTIKGESIFNRKRPLAQNTLRRIWAGLMKYGGKAFVIGQQSGAAPRAIDQPIPTIAGAGAISLIEPFLVPYHGENGKQKPRSHSVDKPLPTVHAGGIGFGLVEPFIMPVNHGKNDMRSYSLNAPMPTITSVDAWSLVEPFLVEYYGTGETSSIDEPIKTLTGRDRFGLVEPLTFAYQGKKYLLDIRFRMLQPHELARAMSFPIDYRFHGNREQVVKQIGNAVPVELAKALCLSLLQTSRSKSPTKKAK